RSPPLPPPFPYTTLFRSRVREILRHVESGAGDGLEESRRVVGALAPADLDEGSLTGALRRVTDRFTEESSVSARLRVGREVPQLDRKSTRLNSSHVSISY